MFGDHCIVQASTQFKTLQKQGTPSISAVRSIVGIVTRKLNFFKKVSILQKQKPALSNSKAAVKKTKKQ